MSSPIGGTKNVKVFVLYLMMNIGYPLDYATVNDIVMINDYVMYLDFAEAFASMVKDGLISICGKSESGDDLYEVAPKGMYVVEAMKSDLLQVVLKESLTCALRYLNFRKRGIRIETGRERLDNSRYRVSFRMIEKKETIFCTELVVDSLARAELMSEYFRSHPEVIYKGTLALVSGEVSYLFGNQ